MKNAYKNCFLSLKGSVSGKKAILIVAAALIVSGFFITSGNALADDPLLLGPTSNVTVTAPTSGVFWRGVQTIQWTDASSSPPYKLFYSKDFGTYQNIISDVSGLSYNWDTATATDGDGNYQIRVENLLGEYGISSAFSIDNTAPVTTATINPPVPDGENGWYVSVPTITLTCNDGTGSGCGTTYYSWDGGSPMTYLGAFTALEGEHFVSYFSEDNAVDKDGAHNAETPKTLEVKLDTIPPEVLSYTFDGFAADFHFNPNTDSVDITINTNEIVKYLRIYICSTSVPDSDCNDANAVKYFTTSSYASTVTKNWDGRNGGGIIVADDFYKIRVHMKDIAGNDIYSVLSPYTMTVDTTSPTIAAPADIIDFEATGPTTPVDLGIPTVHDNLDPNPKVVNDAPSAFPLGLTVVTWTATDWAGNQATDTQNVTIVDTTPPVIDPHINIIEEATSAAGAVVTYTPSMSHDLVDGDLPSECLPASGSTFPLGDTTVTCNKTDAHGNVATPVTFIITVQDTIPPKIDFHPDVTAEATSHDHTIVTYDLPSAYDLVDGTTSVVCLPVSGSEFVLGDTTVNCSSTDSHGNTGYSSFAVHVIDTTPPIIINTPSDFTVVANEFGGAHNVIYDMPTATDLVDVTDEVNCLPASGSTFPLGSTLVTCTAHDNAGNWATPTSFTVTVVPAPINHMHITASPESLKFGDPSVIALIGHDQYHNIVTNNSSTIIVLSVDNDGILDETILTLSEGTDSTNLRKNSVGIVHVTAVSEGLAPVSVTVEFTEADTSSPFVQETFPVNGSSGAPVNVQPYLIFSEPLAAGTVTSANVQLKKAGGDAVSAAISMDFLEGRQRATITPTSVLDFNTQYYFVVTAGVTDLVGNPAIPVNEGTEPSYKFTTVADTGDHIAPTIISHLPSNGATGVSISVAPTINFSEVLNSSTVNSANIQLRKYSDDSIVPAVTSLVEGGTRAIIAPTSPLDYNTQYYFAVSSGVQDLSGNPLASVLDETTKADHQFTTIQDINILAVTGIYAIKTYATADGTYGNGWSWEFSVTVPTTETELQMKFADWTSTLNTIPAANNIRYSSVQASNGPIEITAANTYGDPLHLTTDLDPITSGRQIKILVEAKVPEGSAGGSYSTSYGILTNNP